MVNRKRDRWDSSSDEEDDVKPDVKISQPSTYQEYENIDSLTASSQMGQIKELQSDGTNNNNQNNNDGDTQQTPTISSLPTHNPLLMGCRSVYSCYERLAHFVEKNIFIDC